ncbi:MAG: ATP synthase F1 subunit gamma [Bacteroidota bacterium]|jgi:F-type H+-transporting ATPase subunit gamma|nr:MAG: ATP synthase F1 subunit gamma [Bacteroidota bacterium]
MPSLKEVKNRIGSVISTQQITKAMKMVAAAKLRRSQEKVLQMRPFAQKLTAILQNLSTTDGAEPGWYNKPRPERNILMIVISSDRGLCGSFNSNVYKEVMRVIDEQYSEQRKQRTVTILPLGKRGLEFFRKRDFPVDAAFVNVFHDLTFAHVSAIADHVMDAYRAGKYDKVILFYNEFKNVATQILRIEQYLPVLPPASQEKKVVPIDYIYQPDQEEIISGLIPKSLRVQVFKALLDSNAAENGARMTAMDKATENAGELLRELRLTYNRTRQAAITKEILEIVGGAEALKSS